MQLEGTFQERLPKVEDVYYSERNVLSSSCSQLIEAWILDFGFSYHMTPNREWFTTYRSDNFDSDCMGNNKTCGNETITYCYG